MEPLAWTPSGSQTDVWPLAPVADEASSTSARRLRRRNEAIIPRRTYHCKIPRGKPPSATRRLLGPSRHSRDRRRPSWMASNSRMSSELNDKWHCLWTQNMLGAQIAIHAANLDEADQNQLAWRLFRSSQMTTSPPPPSVGVTEPAHPSALPKRDP